MVACDSESAYRPAALKQAMILKAGAMATKALLQKAI
jgi:hypothetical protein